MSPAAIVATAIFSGVFLVGALSIIYDGEATWKDYAISTGLLYVFVSSLEALA